MMASEEKQGLGGYSLSHSNGIPCRNTNDLSQENELTMKNLYHESFLKQLGSEESSVLILL